jgi:hypothetical protein
VNFGDWTRQTRWAHPPAAAPAGTPPGGLYVRQAVWAICPDCDVQVHGLRTLALRDGLACPDCGRVLVPAAASEESVAAVEERFTAELQAAIPLAQSTKPRRREDTKED